MKTAQYWIFKICMIRFVELRTSCTALLTKGIFESLLFSYWLNAALQWLMVGMAQLAFSYQSASRSGCGSQAGRCQWWSQGERVSPHLEKERHVCISTSYPAKRKPSAFYYGLTACIIYLACLTFPCNILKFISCLKTKYCY